MNEKTKEIVGIVVTTIGLCYGLIIGLSIWGAQYWIPGFSYLANIQDGGYTLASCITISGNQQFGGLLLSALFVPGLAFISYLYYFSSEKPHFMRAKVQKTFN